MKTVALTQEKVALVDDEDFERINQWKWHCYFDKGVWRAIRNSKTTPRRTIYMAREVLLLNPEDPEVDHRDTDGLNNQKGNLRIASTSQNNMNRKGWSACGLKGVSLDAKAKSNPWRAHIRINGRLLHLGSFESDLQAALAYNKKALELFGEFARLNPVYG